MTLELLPLISAFVPSEDFETGIAFYRTKVPWIAPYAYLHIVYKPARFDALAHAIETLNIPSPVVEFLKVQNGARLFSGSLNIFGMTPPGQLLDRKNPYSLLPFDIYRMATELAGFDRKRFLSIGQYGFDGSKVCIDRIDASIKLFPKGSDTPVHSWPDLGEWIRTEIARITLLFDCSGHMLHERSAALPVAKRRVN
jgi:hypothetical protein